MRICHKDFLGISGAFWTYHRFVKTTPNPSATKKRRGEFVVELVPPLLLAFVVVPAVEVVEDILELEI